MPKTVRENLIIGCGHGRYCGQSHPASEFELIDIDSNCRPDHVLNITDASAFKEIYAKSGTQTKFKNIIFEYVPNSVIERIFYLINYLSEDGNLIFFAPSIDSISEIFRSAPLGTRLSFNYNLFDGYVIISKSNTKSPKPDEVAKQYLESTRSKFLNALTQELVVTERNRKHLNHLVIFRDKLQYHGFGNVLRDSIHANILSNPIAKPITKAALQSHLTTYSPGFLRYHFTVGGKTTGIKELERFVSNIKETQLSTESLFDLLKLIQERHYRTYYSLNPTRTGGQTTTIYREILATVVNYLSSTHADIDALLLARTIHAPRLAG